MTSKSQCSQLMDKFLELDKNEKMPLWMTKHFLICEECRRNVRMFSHAERMISREEGQKNPFGYATVSEVKEKLYPGSTKPKKVPLIHWIIIGILLLVCMVLCTIFTVELIPAAQNYVFLFVAASITVYIMLFIGFNMDLFKKQ